MRLMDLQTVTILKRPVIGTPRHRANPPPFDVCVHQILEQYARRRLVEQLELTVAADMLDKTN